MKVPSFPSSLSSLNKVYDLVQYVDQSVLTTAGPFVSNAAGATISIGISFNMLGQSTNLIAIFDQFRIAMIEMTFLPRTNVVDNAAAAVTPGNAGVIYSTVDNDDVAAFTAAAAQQRNTTIVNPGYQKFSHTFVPHVLSSSYNVSSGIQASSLNLVAPWLNTSTPSTGHFGVKAVWTAATTGYYSYDIITRLHVQFRNIQ